MEFLNRYKNPVLTAAHDANYLAVTIWTKPPILF